MTNTETKGAPPGNSQTLLKTNVLLLAATMLASFGSSASIPSIRGIGLYETTTFTGLDKGVSFAGGSDAMIAASLLQA